MKINVGDYVRTKNGIAKYIDDEFKNFGLIVVDKYTANDHMDDYKNIISQDEIIKSSLNIIDLIQVGDYVNGYPVYSVSYLDEDVVKEITVKRPNNRNGVWVDKICNDFEIKSIVTKEQFESMQYVLESEVN